VGDTGGDAEQGGRGGARVIACDQHTHRRRADGEQTGRDRRPAIGVLVDRGYAGCGHQEETNQTDDQGECPPQLDAGDPFVAQPPLQGQREQHP